MIDFIETHREAYGVEPICRVLPIAPSTYYSHAAVARDPGKASDRSKRDVETTETIKRVHGRSKGRYGVRIGALPLARRPPLQLLRRTVHSCGLNIEPSFTSFQQTRSTEYGHFNDFEADMTICRENYAVGMHVLDDFKLQRPVLTKDHGQMY